MSGTAILLDNGATEYETADLAEFNEAIAAAHAEGAKIDIKSHGNGTYIAHILYKDDEDAPEPEGGWPVVVDDDDDEEEDDDDEPVVAKKVNPSTRKR